MSFIPGYGDTPVSPDEADALLPSIRELLGEPITKAGIYDLEQAVQEEVAEELVIPVLEGELKIDDLVSDFFLRELHQKLYGDTWTWAGTYRKRELNIGVAPELIAVELRNSLETIRYHWEHTEDWSARELGIAVHAEAVRIHPFVDGNGRTTRLLADLVFLAAQGTEDLWQYVWELDKVRYIKLLQQYDQHRNPKLLAEFIGVSPLEE
ncbi:Fic family protein [Nesterenkonia aerolata]|uniref:Fic family protein n=1 Tax=Nesterenkonia aerolata TaxID=3074079 RepID=A0ABU2DQN7_9MICC|nr:Fic family protein [Nesterenkonia sp. LY-0111]MDR8018716.1 Fic family protein [Nesterenkonia sp. LY-0111]